MKQILFVLALYAIIAGCSTGATVQSSGKLKGKTIGMVPISVSFEKKPKKFNLSDSLYAAIAQSTKEALIPYLQQAGFKVIDLPLAYNASMDEAIKAAEASKAEYIFTGAGMADATGKSLFMHKLNVRLISLTTSEIAISGSFSGAGVFINGAAERVGKQIVKKMQ